MLHLKQFRINHCQSGGCKTNRTITLFILSQLMSLQLDFGQLADKGEKIDSRRAVGLTQCVCPF